MGKLQIEGIGTFTVDNAFGELPEEIQQSYVNELKSRYAAKGVAADMTGKPDYATMGALELGKTAVSNIPHSAVELVKSVAQPFIHPIETGTQIGNIGKGVLQKLGIMEGKEAEPYADAVGKFLMDRYGSGAAIKKSLAEDPVGMAADLSLVLTGGGSALARAPGVLGKVGEAARAIDPLAAAVKGTTAVAGRVGSEVLGMTTGAGREAVQAAYRTGAEGGEAGQAFRESMRGTTPVDEVVEEARGAVSNLKQERGAIYRKEMTKLGADKTVLDFEKVDKAVSIIGAIKTYKGQELSPKTAAIREELGNTVAEWKNLDPSEFHTAEGLDALKQKIGNIRDATQYGTPERAAADQTYQAVRGTIVNQAPEYSKIMKGYEQATSKIKEIERTLSLNPNASIDTALRKIMSSLRDNVNTNFGKRKELVAFLARSGAPNLLNKIAGRALASGSPRGLARLGTQEALTTGLGLAAGGLTGAGIGMLAALPASSPRLVGEALHGLGRARRRLRHPVSAGTNLGQSEFQTGRGGE